MKRIPTETWEQIKTAYASGIGLRELARNMDIPAGTVLARAKREGWTRQIREAKALVPRPAMPAISPTEAVARTMQERGERHVERMAGAVERVMGVIEAMEPEEILQIIDRIETLDKVGRRTYGLGDNGAGNGIETVVPIQINIG